MVADCILNKEKLFLTFSGIVCFIIAIINNFIIVPIKNYELLEIFLLDGAFILFGLFLAIKGKNVKRFLNVKFVIAFILSLIAFEILNMLTGAFLYGFNLLLMVSIEYVGKVIITGAVFYILIKLTSKNIKIFNKKIILYLSVGIIALFVLRIALFQIFESTYYGNLFNLTNNGFVEYLSMLITPTVSRVISDLVSLLMPTVFGFSVYCNN